MLDIRSVSMGAREQERAARALLVVLFGACVGYAILGSFAYGSAGSRDFIQYFTAYHAVAAGLDPYVPNSLEPLQRSLGRSGESLMYWGPPWLLVLQAPLHELPFEVAARGWFVLNSMFLMLAAGIAARLYCPDRMAVGMLAGALSIPALHGLVLGQVSLLLAMGVVLVLIGIEKGRTALGGLGLALLTIKPHLFLLVGVLVLWRCVRFRIFALPAWGLAWMGAMIAATRIVFPTSLSSWLRTLTGDPAGVTSRLEWRTATLADLVRMMSGPSAEALPGWPIVIVPLIASLIFLVVLVLRRYSRETADRGLFHVALPASLTFAPFGWFFDASVLVPTQVAITNGRATSRETGELRPGIFIAIVLLQGASFLALRSADYQHELFWYPIVLLVLALWWWKSEGSGWRGTA